MRRGVVATFVLLAAACTARTQSAQQEPQADASTAAPVITHIEPDTIPLGQAAVPTLVIYGSGFAAGGAVGIAEGRNTVHIGRALIERVSSDASGKTLRFELPLTYADTTSSGRPSVFGPGQYVVSVTTPRGTSNTLTLTMIR